MTYSRAEIARAIVDHAGLMAEHQDPELVLRQVGIADVDGVISTLGTYAAGPLAQQVQQAHESQDLPPMTLPAIIQVGLFHGLAIGLRLARGEMGPPPGAARGD